MSDPLAALALSVLPLADSVRRVDLPPGQYQIIVLKLLDAIAAAAVAAAPGGLGIPAHDNAEFTYFGSTNNIQTITYKVGGNPVGTLTFTYVGGGAADDDDIETYALT